MPILKDIKSTVKLSGCGVEKARCPRKRSSARTALSSEAALDTPTEVSSGCSDQNAGSANWESLARTSSNQDFRLACPYAKLNSMLGTQSIRASDMGRPRCWSKSYPNISRLKYAEIPPRTSFRSRQPNDADRSAIGNTCIAFTAG
jgi:hypothetical protein